MGDASVAQWMEGWRAGMEQAARIVRSEGAGTRSEREETARRIMSAASPAPETRTAETPARSLLRTLREVIHADPEVIAAAERVCVEMERAPETCSGCGKSISGPRFCLSCLERVDVTIGAPETRTGEGAATGCATCEHAVMWGPYKADCKAGHGYGIDAKWCCGDYRSARAPSPLEGTP